MSKRWGDEAEYREAMNWLMKQMNREGIFGIIILTNTENSMDWQKFGEIDFADLAFAGALLQRAAVEDDDD